MQIPLNVTAMAPFVAEPRLQLGYQVSCLTLTLILTLTLALSQPEMSSLQLKWNPVLLLISASALF